MNTSAFYGLVVVHFFMYFLMQNRHTRLYKNNILFSILFIYIYLLYRLNDTSYSSNRSIVDILVTVGLFLTTFIPMVFSPTGNIWDDLLFPNNLLFSRVGLAGFITFMSAYYTILFNSNNKNLYFNLLLLLLPIIAIFGAYVYYTLTESDIFMSLLGEDWKITKETRVMNYRRLLPVGVVGGLLFWRSLWVFFERTQNYAFQTYIPLIIIYILSLLQAPGPYRYMSSNNIVLDDKCNKGEACASFPTSNANKFVVLQDGTDDPRLSHEPSIGLNKVQLYGVPKDQLYKTLPGPLWGSVLLLLLTSTFYFSLESKRKNILIRNSDDMISSGGSFLVLLLLFHSVIFTMFKEFTFPSLELTTVILNLMSIDFFRSYSLKYGLGATMGDKGFILLNGTAVTACIFILSKTVAQSMDIYSDIVNLDSEIANNMIRSEYTPSRKGTVIVLTLVSLFLYLLMYTESVLLKHLLPIA